MATTNEEKKLIDLFQKFLGALPLANKTSSPTSILSVRGNEDYKVESKIGDEKDGVHSLRDACDHQKWAAEIIHPTTYPISRSPFGLFW